MNCLVTIEIRESILEKSLSVSSLASFPVSFIVPFIRLTFGKEFRRLDVGFGATNSFYL
jgi:hypothetical protein